MTSITIYDGAETIGGNKIYVEEKDKGVFLDFGLNFARHGDYFAEFITERDVRGIYDLIYLNIIPKLNIYRQDLIPMDVNIEQYKRLNVSALLISHAHLDHCGNAGYLSKDIPFIVSPITSAILKGMRDTSPSKLGMEVSYYVKRKANDDPRVLTAPRKEPYCGRDIFLTTEISAKLEEFLCSKPGTTSKNAKKYDPGSVENICDHNCRGNNNIPFEIKAYDVDHSIYGATAFILEGDTSIAYTGDFRLHGKNADKTRKFIKNAKNVSVLIVEGTRASRDEEYNSSEENVFKMCKESIDGYDGLIIADFSNKNFERLEMFEKIAKETGRELVISPKDAYMLHAIECAEKVCRIDNILIYKELKSSFKKWETEIVKEKYGKKYVDPNEISRETERYILCFSFYNLKHLLDIKPERGRYVYSSCEAFTEEQEFDFVRLYNWLKNLNFETYGFKIGDNGKPEFEKGYHASGHISQEELEEVIGEIDPEILIPVHTINPEWFIEKFEMSKIMKNGDSVTV